MVRHDVIARKLARASAWLDDAAPALSRPRAEFLADRAQRDLATFYLFLAIQECIDIAAHWVADEGWGSPDEAGATFDVLAERGIIPASVATRLRGATALRNRIAHGYASVDHDRLHAEACMGLRTLREFLAAVSASAGI